MMRDSLVLFKSVMAVIFAFKLHSCAGNMEK